MVLKWFPPTPPPPHPRLGTPELPRDKKTRNKLFWCVFYSVYQKVKKNGPRMVPIVNK